MVTNILIISTISLALFSCSSRDNHINEPETPTNKLAITTQVCNSFKDGGISKQIISIYASQQTASTMLLYQSLTSVIDITCQMLILPNSELNNNYTIQKPAKPLKARNKIKPQKINLLSYDPLISE